MKSRVTRPRALLLSIAIVACNAKTPPPPTTPGSQYRLTATMTDRTFRTAEHMLASLEMQLSGEPFAQLMGRNLVGYDRFGLPTDLYYDPAGGAPKNDPLGYSLAVESYEYSKQPMNNLSFESGAGLSLMFGPLLNPTGLTGDPAYVLLRDRVQHFALASSSGGPSGTNFVVSPAPSDNPLNIYGWPGFWPAFAPFRSFDPQIAPAGGATRGCSMTAGYATVSSGQAVGDYECGSNSLNLPLRELQIESVLDAAALGFSAWKKGLWIINYWQSAHDSAGNGIVAVADADLAQVGKPGNVVVGQFVNAADPNGALIKGQPGTYLGDIPLEGFQGLTMIEELDNQAAYLLGRLLTSDGATLGGFASTKEALAYDYRAPIRALPTAITVAEQKTAPSSAQAPKYFPKPVSLTIASGAASADGASGLRGIAGLLGGYAQLFALTDGGNRDVGGLVGPRATFDGDPFPADDGLPDGEETAHDRALAVLKLSLINLDRLHHDLARHVLVDSATLDAAGAVHRGSVVGTVTAAYTIVAIRTALRSIRGSLTLYSNDTPDTLGAPTALDGSPVAGVPAPGDLAGRALSLLREEADFLDGTLVGTDGVATNSFDLSTGARDPSPLALSSQASAIRGLLEAYLATSDERYRQHAMRAWAVLEARFYYAAARIYRTSEIGAPDADTAFHYTPLAFGTLQAALRQYWKLVARRPGNEALAATLTERIKRLNKLVLNGWDDANGDDHLAFPDECTGAGLQMAERALTDELSHPQDGPDRDHDCVREISAAQLPAALAAEIVLTPHLIATTR